MRLMMIKIAASIAGAVALLAAGGALAEPIGKTIAEQGNGQGAAPCSSCHGSNYEGNPAIKAPALAWLSSDYIASRLAHYASPEGHNPLMKQVATALSPSEREAVAAYLSSLKAAPKTTTGPGTAGR
jgi:cytochrome c553